MKLPKFKKGEAVRITWNDACQADHGWHQITKKEMNIHGMCTVGQVHRQRRDRLTLVLTHDVSEGAIDSAITIPTAVIQSYQRLG